MIPSQQGLPALDTLLYESTSLKVGRFEVHPNDPRFSDSGPIENFPVVFPGTRVWIRRRRERVFLTDRQHVLLYNRNQRYIRRKASPLGDRCHWFSFAPAILSEVAQKLEPKATSEKPYCRTKAPCAADVFLSQQLLIRHLELDQTKDPLIVEESYLEILRRVLARPPSGSRDSPHSRSELQCHEELVSRALEILGQRFRETLSLQDIAREVYTSPFHLCRVFRQQTGSTIHAYRHQIRLRAGLEEVLASPRELTEIALDLGFSSHSHFTSAFRSLFGWTPSALRNQASISLIRRLRDKPHRSSVRT